MEKCEKCGQEVVIGYGFFVGGDPRKFHPDPESSTKEERAYHATACKEAENGRRYSSDCKHVGGAILTAAQFGLGSYELCGCE